MNASFPELYLKLNLLIAVAFVLWVATKQLHRLLQFEASHAQQLKVARTMFAGLLIAVPLMVLMKALVPEWAKGMVAAVSGTGIIQEFTFTAGAKSVLASKYEFGLLALDAKSLLVALLLAGLLVQLANLTLQVVRLRKIMSGAVEWKSIHGIHLLISESITSPFSTRALGSKQIVLPVQLLESPRNLQLAIKHELQHVRNGDLEWVILLEAVKVLCFWNPAVWLWHNEFDCLQEFACDEVLVNERGVNSQAYGSCLLDVASSISGRAMLASSNMVPKFSLWQDHKHQLQRRILMLVNTGNKKNTRLKTLCYSLLIGFGLMDAAVMVFAAGSDMNGARAKPASAVVKAKQEFADAQMRQQLADAMTRSAAIKFEAGPVVRVNPEYPAAALSHGLDGQVLVQFTIDETGSVQDVVALRSCVWSHPGTVADCKEDDSFKESALAAVKKWKYAAARNSGIAVKRRNVQTMLRYQLED